MSDLVELPGELLYVFTPKLLSVTEYGASMDALMANEASPPLEGARFDIHSEGPVRGNRLSGSARTTDYVQIRADGRFQLHIHGEITTDDGMKIALFADGVLFGDPPVLQARENVTLTTSHKAYAWVNPLQIWATGTLNAASGEITIQAYAV